MPAKRYDVCATDDVQPGSMISVAINGLSIALVRDEDGEFFALRNSCPHMGALLSDGRFQARMDAGEDRGYVVSRHEHVLRCPWHGYEFDVRTGRCAGDPDRIRVKTYPVTIASGRVYIER